ncbi:hypothetical protein PUN28_017953 [Cardiocondyla obscurior]|uniref:Uncharacterized protein n=1 Tax=Cardiocondyla obscurior TaxID=286306 RepID=A0AAW2EJE5_9HYME
MPAPTRDSLQTGAKLPKRTRPCQEPPRCQGADAPNRLMSEDNLPRLVNCHEYRLIALGLKLHAAMNPSALSPPGARSGAPLPPL